MRVERQIIKKYLKIIVRVNSKKLINVKYLFISHSCSVITHGHLVKISLISLADIMHIATVGFTEILRYNNRNMCTKSPHMTCQTTRQPLNYTDLPAFAPDALFVRTTCTTAHNIASYQLFQSSKILVDKYINATSLMNGNKKKL